MDLYEALYTTRAMRRVKPDPIPEEVVRLILDAAVRSPSGGNTQNWRFLTVSDRETMARLGAWYAEAWETL
ncbi:MAG: nitroreductase, partial [Actinobacteria bacterium]